MTDRGLTVREWKTVRNSDLSYGQNCVTALAPFAGFTPRIIAHLRSDWVEWRDEFVRIDVPTSAPCNEFKSSSNTGEPTVLTRRTKPCQDCQNSESNRFENTFRGLGKHNPSEYTAILHRDIAEPAVNFLEMVFKSYDRPEIALTPGGVRKAARKVYEGVEVGISSPNATTLLRTGPVIYCHFGLELDDIVELTPYSKKVCKRIIRSTPEVNLHNISTIGFLRKLNDIEPATKSEMSDEINRSPNNIGCRLRKLKERSRVTVKNGGYGRPAGTWETTEKWKDPFCCDECGFKSYSIIGIKKHKQMH